MIEKILIKYLSAAFSGDNPPQEKIPVYMTLPPNPARRCIVIEKTGGGAENHIFHATVAVQSYGETLLAAAELNERVKSVMENIITEPSVSACRLNSDYNFTDPQSKKYRYQAVFHITHY